MKKVLYFSVWFIIMVSCMQNKPVSNNVNALTNDEIKQGWKLLFDGETLSGWRNFKSDSLTGWTIDSNHMLALGIGGDYANDIITVEEYENFELWLEWKNHQGGNSGIFFNAKEDPSVKAIYEIAPEYQVIDEVTWPGDSLADWQPLAR